MAEHTVTLRVSGLDDEGVRVAALVDAGLDDALITQDRTGGTGTIEVELEGDLVQLVTNIVETAERAGVRVLSVEPQTLVTAADIAERTGRSRQAVAQLISGQRGRGGFPPAINPGARHQLWRWSDVKPWFTASEPEENELVLDVLNEIVALRASLERLQTPSRVHILNSSLLRPILRQMRRQRTPSQAG